MMRRWFAILFLMLLPLQSTWAAVAGYCQHEADRSASHIGHHEHQHGASHASDKSLDAQKANAAIDLDCASCHANLTSAVFQTSALALPIGGSRRAHDVPPHITSALTTPPDRPDWARLA